MADVVFRYVSMAASVRPLAMYEAASAGETTSIDDILAAGDAVTTELSGTPPISETDSVSVEVGQSVILFDYPDVASQTRILLENAHDRMAFIANELISLSAQQIHTDFVAGGIRDTIYHAVGADLAPPSYVYEQASAADTTTMDNIEGAGDVVEIELNAEPVINSFTSPTVEVGQVVIHLDYPDSGNRYRILIDTSASQVDWLAHELFELQSLDIELTKERLYFAHLLGGWVSQEEVKGGIEALERGGATRDEALEAAVAGPMVDAAAVAAEDL